MLLFTIRYIMSEWSDGIYIHDYNYEKNTITIMAKIKKMTIGEAVLNHNNIQVKKSFFGTKVIYTPTGCAVKGYDREYASSDGELIKSILTAPDGKLEQAVNKAKGKLTPAIGNARLEMCFSSDGQFAALQLFKFQSLAYHPDGGTKIYEGDDAKLLFQLFLK